MYGACSSSSCNLIMRMNVWFMAFIPSISELMQVKTVDLKQHLSYVRKTDGLGCIS